MRSERFVIEVIKGKRKGLIPNILKTFLHLLSWLFRLGVACRNWAFDSGWLHCYYPPVPVVISIGNIVAGGTGKTPVTLMIAQEFYKNYSIAILSRGYRSPAEKFATPVVLSKGEGPMHPASFCGDEPFLISQNLPEAFVFVGKDRHKASYMAAKAGAQLILLDDGMQHRRLARDFEVVVMDLHDPFGQGYFLPRGFLRESMSSLARSHIIIINHVDDHEKFLEMKNNIALYSKAPVIGVKMEVSHAFDFAGNPVDSLQGKKVGIFCSIANPDYFHTTILGQGAHVISNFYNPDHIAFKPEALAAFAQASKAQGAELLLCTEKDRVKITDLEPLALPIAWVKIELILVEGKEEWQEFIQKTKSRLTIL